MIEYFILFAILLYVFACALSFIMYKMSLEGLGGIKGFHRSLLIVPMMSAAMAFAVGMLSKKK